MQFFGHEEGRIRPKTVNQAVTYEYDYFVKDHLGNVRMVLTSEKQTDIYQAGIEPGNRDFEVALFGDKVNTTAYPKPDPGFDEDGNNTKVSMLNGSTAAGSIGPGVILKVMAGDKIKARSFAWYLPGGNTGTDPILNDILLNLLGQLTPGIAGAGKGTAAQNITNGFLQPGIEDLFEDHATETNRPRAYINWILFDDEQFQTETGSYGSTIIPAMTERMQKQLLQANDGDEIEIKKNGYIYVFVSNESKMNVYFDDIRVEHVRGALLEETHYYPWGLTMAGISSQAIAFGQPENKHKFNKGSELQDKEFSDGSGLEWYATSLRTLDPQLGRWWQIDSKPNHAISPYAAMENNSILHYDPLGDSIIVGQITASIPIDAPRGGNSRMSITSITIEGKLINESSTSYTSADMQGFADRINASISSSYTVTDGNAISIASSNVTVESGANPLESSDHAFRIVDGGTLAKITGVLDAIGYAPFGEKIVYLSQSLLSNTPAITGPYAGSGKTASGDATLERTAGHEIGHSATLRHPAAGTMPGNLMNQTMELDAGMEINGEQIKQISDANQKGLLNKGRQKI